MAGVSMLLYSLFGSKLYYLRDNQLTEIRPRNYSIFIPPDYPLTWIKRTNYALTVAAFRDSKGNTDGKLYLTLINPKTSSFYKLMSLDELKEKVLKTTGKEITPIGFTGYRDKIYIFAKGRRKNYLLSLSYGKGRAIQLVSEEPTVIQFSSVGDNLVFLCHPKGKPFSIIKKVDLKTGKVTAIAKGKVILPMLSHKYISYFSFKNRNLFLIVRDIDSGEITKTFQVALPSIEGLYFQVTDNLKVIMNDSKGFYVFE